jgi:predicted dehydrogenase
MKPLRFAMFGCGYWAPFQLAGWQELDGVECAALYNRTRSKAEKLAERFGVPAAYDDPQELLASEPVDFLDIVTDVGTHARFVHLAAEHKLPVICQKPLATGVREAEGMLSACRSGGVPLLVHENWRWQEPIRQVKAVLDAGTIGRVFRGRIQYSNSHPVFENQPFLRDLEQFILTDMGSHILDVARFLFGEPERLVARTTRVHEDIRGEDVATVLLDVPPATVTCELSYASRLERERFPEAFILVEGERGSVELAPDYWVRVTTGDGTHARRHPPPHYPWAEPTHDVVHASIVPCCADLLRALRGEGTAETTGEDNLKTVRLVYAAYASAETGRVVEL